jgi:hypothetical protein
MLTLPVLTASSGTVHPLDDTCASCGAAYDRDREYVALDALTTLAEDRSFTKGTTSELNETTVGLWHVRNYSRREGSKLDIFRDVRGGHAMIFFCSTRCLRTFLNSVVDALEAGTGEDLSV